VQLHRTWLGSRRDLQLSLASDDVEVMDVDPYWGRDMPPGDRDFYGFIHHDEPTIQLTYQIRCEPIDDVLRHALEPVMDVMGLAVTTFAPITEEECRSIAHTLIALWLASDLREPIEVLIERYNKAVWATTRAWPPPRYGAPGSFPAMKLLLRALCRDANRLPAANVLEWSQSIARWRYLAPEHRPVLRDCLLAIQTVDPEEDRARQAVLEAVQDEGSSWLDH
jgi:hypothetical protein